MKDYLIDTIASETHVSPEDVSLVIGEFALQLHRRIYEYQGSNGDYIGEQLRWDVSPQSFYHLLGFLGCATSGFEDPYPASEYLLRLGQREEWIAYRHQMDGWKSPAEKSEARNGARD